jgi:SAM-dependent methyltransferase
MKHPVRLRDEIETAEAAGAALARVLAEALMQPTGDRPPLAAPLADFAERHQKVGHLIAQLRRMVGRAVQAEAGAGKTVADFARAARTRHLIWGRTLAAVRDCLAGQEWPLLPPPRPRLDLGTVQEGIVAKVFTDAHAAVNPLSQDDAARDLGCFSDIALDVDRFVWNAHLACRILMARKVPRPWSFLDVGCGSGMKVALAAEMFDAAHGLDYDPGYVEVANRALAAMRAGRCRAFHDNGLSFGGYGGYDVIYFFQPMRDPEGLQALERQIVVGARDGAILLGTYPGFLWRAEALGCRQVMADVYIKGLDEDARADLIAETRRMGPHVPLHGKGVPRGAAWLRPLWLACLANGIRAEERVPPDEADG